ncbi:hypothetical protein GLOTRDRAFT_41871, partial [Gloeophyllum trabeum ATCC 11539]
LLKPRDSPLRPHCRADERLFLWRGVNQPPLSVIDNPIIHHLADMASRASLRDTSSYGSGLQKFHLFCDIFSIPETRRLPASFSILHSFALWAPISVKAARKYLSAVRAWHLAQGWPPPLSQEESERINWLLRGLDNIQLSKRSRPPRQPITIAMLTALKLTLNLSDPFDACIWTICSCSFFGLMRFGEATVKSRADFDGSRHLKRIDSTFAHDLDGRRYARLDLPAAKTAKPGEIQHIFLNEQGNLCPLWALENLVAVVPASATDPLFSWRDSRGLIRPMARSAALARINGILYSLGWGTAFCHSFRIGGASFFLAKGVSPELMRIAGRWRSLAYETYIRAFEQITSRHMSNLHSSGTATTLMVG